MQDARARLAAGDLAGAAELLRAAAGAWHEIGDAAEEARCLRLAAALARHAGHRDEAVTLAGRAVDAAPGAATYREAGAAALADRKDPVAARMHAERARTEALAGRSATGYLAAAVALAALADAVGDRAGAYAALAVGWATLRDLVGADGARAAFQPHLLALRERWGTAAFAGVKAAYEARVPRP